MVQGSNNKSKVEQTEKRKTQHIHICLNEDVKAKKITTGFEDIYMLHRALPEVNRDKISLTTEVFGHRFSAPLIITGITGGSKKALEINTSLAEAIEELNLGMGVGSQRAALENPKLEKTFSIVRKKAPNAFLIANLGGSQLIKEYHIKKIIKAIEMIEADALAIHLNPLQEAVQPEGETDHNGILEKIEEITDFIKIPLIIKETGAGIAAEEAKKIKRAGVTGIDVAGAGGTSWSAVEYYRAKESGHKLSQESGRILWDWGIPTVISLIEVLQSVDISVIASGGVRSGLDTAKALSLGAELVGFALPFLSPASRSSEEVKKKLTTIIHQLRTIMFLTGVNSIKEIKSIPLIITGNTAEWLRMRSFNIEKYARR
jgi:isopentenyl-diphosphate delta-isomerase